MVAAEVACEAGGACWGRDAMARPIVMGPFLESVLARPFCNEIVGMADLGLVVGCCHAPRLAGRAY
jgi:hypothetical protein